MFYKSLKRDSNALRGRPVTGKAKSGAQRMRELRQRQKAKLALIIVTRDEKSKKAERV